MSRNESSARSRNDDWPAFALRYTFNPEGLGEPGQFAPDELVVRDPSRGDGAWLSAARGAYVAIEDIR